MRKKSHVYLAQFIADQVEWEELKAHRKAFLLGSILPDCVPSFLTRRHTIDECFELMMSLMDDIYDTRKHNRAQMRRLCRNLGQVTHYVADFFTYPHNKEYPGSMKQHCHYENWQKLAIRKYLRSEEAQYDRAEVMEFDSTESIGAYIRELHAKYSGEERGVDHDISYIVQINVQIVEALINLFIFEKGIDIPSESDKISTVANVCV